MKGMLKKEEEVEKGRCDRPKSRKTMVTSVEGDHRKRILVNGIKWSR